MLNICGRCTTKFAVGCDHCPQCGNADYYPEDAVAKINSITGASVVGETREDAAAATKEPKRPAPKATFSVVAKPGTGDDLLDDDVDTASEYKAQPAVSQYEPKLLTDLRDECRRRGLAITGNKSDLVARLDEDDESKVKPTF